MSSMSLISHRMLVSAVPHQAEEESMQAEQQDVAASPAQPAECQVLAQKDLAAILDRDQETFGRTPPKNHGKLSI